MKRSTVLLAASFLCAGGLGLFAESACAQPANDPVTYLDQGWSQADREMYYQISQGSTVIDYNIFLNLEVAPTARSCSGRTPTVTATA